ncbi:unnamed protein product [Allacma fusca]|uniref:Uncharacterized protein n=1 Tax=Allacma fusca TaxID=39272 RepID=A0A8J2PG03_9HEXA|nr:unnamed protein product [Allacma fusca]
MSNLNCYLIIGIAVSDNNTISSELNSFLNSLPPDSLSNYASSGKDDYPVGIISLQNRFYIWIIQELLRDSILDLAMAASIHPTFLIETNETQPSQQWFLCGYCPIKMVQMNSLQDMLFIVKNHTNQGRDIIVQYYQRTQNSPIFSSGLNTEESPFDRDDQSRSADIAYMAYVLGDINQTADTLCPRSDPCSNLKVYSTFRPGRRSFPLHGQVFFTGKTTQYSFITDAMITQGRLESLGILSPFDLFMWILLSLAIIAIGSLVTLTMRTRPCGISWWLSLIRAVLWAGVVLLEQVDKATPPGVKKVRPFLKILFVMWAILAVVITNAYKGVMNSEMTVEFPYETNLKSIDQMRNVSLHFLVKDHVCDFLSQIGRNDEDGCESALNLIECLHFNLLKIMIHEQFNEHPGIKLLCEKYIGPVVYKTSGNAFIITENVFSFFWIKFLKRAMSKEAALKFAYRQDSKDSFLRRHKGFCLTEGIEEIQPWIPRRIRAFFWEKWQDIRLMNITDKEHISLEKELHAPKALSLLNSDFIFIFLVLAVGIIFSIICIVSECLLKVVCNHYRNTVEVFYYLP